MAVGVTQGSLALEAARIANTLAGKVGVLWPDPASMLCGQRPGSLKCCPNCLGPECPEDDSGSGFWAGGAKDGDPVNLATGELEYRPAPDLAVYNPKGPSVSWSRFYNSLSDYGSGFGDGWSHPYNVGVAMPRFDAPNGGAEQSSGGGGRT